MRAAARELMADVRGSRAGGCTLERTWDGKSNLLDFKWIPSDVRPQ